MRRPFLFVSALAILLSVDALEFVIEGFTGKGKGLATLTDSRGGVWPVECSGALPGERVRAQLGKRRKGRYRLWSYDLVERSPQRVPARCQHAGVCGGCRWQSLAYPAQLEWKMECVRRLFGDSLVAPIIPCDPPWAYRLKMEFSFSESRSNERFLGLMMLEGRGRVVNVRECHLCHPWFSAALAAVREWWEGGDLRAYYPPKDEGALRSLTLREAAFGGDRLGVLTVSGRSAYALTPQNIESFIDALARVAKPAVGDLSIVLREQHIAKGHPTTFTERLLYGKGYLSDTLRIGDMDPVPLRVSPSAFFQPNRLQIATLYAKALQLACIDESDTVLDLCCGTGTLALLAAKAGACQVFGIDLCEEAINDAKAAASLSGLDNLTFIKGDLQHACALIPVQCDLVLVDPPRVGLQERGLSALGSLQPKRIVYISCNPWSQGRDVSVLQGAGYRVTCVQPIDQFPHTPHIENIVLLSRVAPIACPGL